MSDRIAKELRVIAERVVKENNLNWVDLEQIEFCKRGINKDCFADIRRIRFPASLYTGKMHIVSTYLNFEELNEKKKEIVILHELLHIDPEDPEKLLKHDVEDFSVILKKYGVDWQVKEVKE